MAGNVAPLFAHKNRRFDWTNQELAEFYRVEDALVRAGLRVETDRGVSDEGEPWFIFCNADTGEVVIHFARIDNVYVAASAAFDGVLRGMDFRTLVECLLIRHPMVVPQLAGGKIRLHPTAFLVALVATAFFKLAEVKAQADEADTDRHGATGEAAGTGGEGTDAKDAAISMDRRQAALILAAITFAASHEGLDSVEHTVFGQNLAFEFHDSPERPSARLVGEMTLVSKVDAPMDAERSRHADAPLTDAAVAPKSALTPHVAAHAVGDGLALVSVLHNIVEPESGPDSAVEPSIPASGSVLNLALPISGEAEAASHSPSSTGTQTHNDTSASHSHGSSTTLVSAEGHHGSDTSGSERVAVVLNAAETSSLPATKSLEYAQNHLATSAQPDLVTLFEGLIAGLVLAQEKNKEQTAQGGDAASTQSPPEQAPASTQPDEGIAADLQAVIDSLGPRQHMSDRFGDLADRILTQFAQDNPDQRMLLSGRDVLIFDPTPSQPGDAHFVTWTFDDGSTISLVGVFSYDVPAHA